MLINRNSQIPNGLKFYSPILKWEAPAGASFRQICEGYAMAIRGNGALARQAGLPMTMPAIEQAVDDFNTAICVKNNWLNFVQGGSESATPFPKAASSPRLQRTTQQKLASVAAGGSVLVEWLASGAEAVAPELANSRAAVCAGCPSNEQGDWSRWFTVPIAVTIRKALDTRKTWKLSTPSDDRLMVCAACLCPMLLKVHVPLDKFYDRMTPESKEDLDGGCWIRKEVADKLKAAVDDGLKKQ
jgi:hypothetical protein